MSFSVQVGCTGGWLTSAGGKREGWSASAGGHEDRVCLFFSKEKKSAEPQIWHPKSAGSVASGDAIARRAERLSRAGWLCLDGKQCAPRQFAVPNVEDTPDNTQSVSASKKIVGGNQNNRLRPFEMQTRKKYVW